MNDADPVLDVAAAVADGEPLNWTVIESSVGGDGQSLRQLKILAEIARIHRELSEFDGQASFSAAASRARSTTPADSSEGWQWGPLVVRNRLGAGSFGEVYRAWDTALAREVALKLLRDRRESVADSIVREGQLLARVNHPNVMHIYGAQQADGKLGIWGELLDGRTLAHIVENDGPLSADETLVAADATCRALAAVHRAGLLHRDVKAQNVIREKGGRIVLTDFGLGRSLDDSALMQSSDLAGTPLYLAPEIFAGGRASVQSDLYALGVLMFYLATGTYPVSAKTVPGIAAAHSARHRIKLQDVRPELPTPFVQLVDRALHPDPAQRFASAGEMQGAITSARHLKSTEEHRDSEAWHVRQSVVIMALVAVAGVAAAATAWVLSVLEREAPAARTRQVAIEPPPNTRFSSSSRNMPALSPDGRYLAVSATDNVTGKVNLWLHSFETATNTMVPDSERALAPFWAPDSSALGFFDPGGVIKRVTVAGVVLGSTRTGQEPRGAAWSARGILLYTKGPRSGLYQQSLVETGERATPERLVIAPDRTKGELAYMWPQFLPDANRFIYFALSNDPRIRGVYLSALDGRPPVLLANTDASAILTGSDLLYVKNDTLVRQPFVDDEGRVDGGPTSIMSGVATNYDWKSIISAAADGTLSYLPAQDATELVWFDRAGREGEALRLPAARYRSPALSRDGQFLAVQRYRDSVSEIQVFELDTLRLRPSIAQSAEVQFAVWGPGHLLAYGSSDEGHSDIYVKDFDRDEPPTLLYAGRSEAPDADMMPTDWTRDGEFLVFVEYSREQPYTLFALPLAQGQSPIAVRPGEGSQIGGHVSPDGRSIVYLRRPPLRPGELPERELWASAFPSGGKPRRLAAGVNDPAWPTENILSYMDARGVLILLRRVPDGSVLKETAFETGVHTPEGSRNNYAWTWDGSRMLVNRPVYDPARQRVMILEGGTNSSIRGVP